MTDTPKTCQVRVHGNKPCGRPLYDGEKCICHSDDPKKDEVAFDREIKKQLAREDYHDFTRFVFPDGYNFEYVEFPLDAHFWHAKFTGDVLFAKAKFSGEARFNFARFSGTVDFRYAKFSGEVAFNEAEFSRLTDYSHAEFSEKVNFILTKFYDEADFLFTKFYAKSTFFGAKFFGKIFFDRINFLGWTDFSYVEFSGTVFFRKAKFSGEAVFSNVTFDSSAKFVKCLFSDKVQFSNSILTEKARITFDNENQDDVAFQKEADFIAMTTYEGAVLHFRKISIETCRFLETDLRKVQFSDVTWPRSRRTCVYDELAPDVKWINWDKSEDKKEADKPDRFQYSLIAQLYRHLQSNFMESNNYSQAGEFHIGEREMMRKSKGKWRQYFCTDVLYKIVSNYGESFIRPFAWLVSMLLLFPAIFLWGGVELSVKAKSASYYPFEGILSEHWCSYWTLICKNVMFLTYSRTDLTNTLIYTYQKALAGIELVLIVTLIAFFLLALRRQFKRKSF